MARKENRPNVELQVERSLGEFSFAQSVDGATPWVDKMFLRFVDRVEVWIRPKLSWDERDLFDRRQMAADIVTESTDHLRKNKLEWAICDMISMCSTIANRKIANAHEHSMCKKNSAILKSIDAETSFDPIDRNRENRPDFELEFQESLDHIWNALDEKQKRIAELSQDENQTDKTMAEEIGSSPTEVRRIRESGMEVARHHLDIRHQRSTINDQRSTINDQRSTINDQRSTINDQRGGRQISSTRRLFWIFFELVWRNRIFS